MKPYNNDRWHQWMQDALAGDAHAYRELLENVQCWLSAYFKKRLPYYIAEELVQDTLLALHRKRHTYDPAQPVGAWIAAIARYRWIDYIRRNKTQYEVILADDTAHTNAIDITAAIDVQQLLGLLPASQSEMITLVKLQGMRVDDVARHTGRSASSVKILVHRGMQKMMMIVKGYPE